LDHADQKPHRHALHRRAHADWHQGAGPGPQVVQKIGEDLENIIRDIRGTRSILAERTAGGYYLDFVLKRDELARYGLSVQDAQEVIMSAIGGENVTTAIEGRERYSINVRYAREFRDDVERLKRVLVPTSSGAHIPWRNWRTSACWKARP